MVCFIFYQFIAFGISNNFFFFFSSFLIWFIFFCFSNAFYVFLFSNIFIANYLFYSLIESDFLKLISIPYLFLNFYDIELKVSFIIESFEGDFYKFY